MLELIAPKIGGVTLTDGTHVVADQNVDGGPSVLYDAVALLPSIDGAAALALDAAAKDFVTDAHAHCKFIGHVASAAELLQAAGVAAGDRRRVRRARRRRRRPLHRRLPAGPLLGTRAEGRCRLTASIGVAPRRHR